MSFPNIQPESSLERLTADVITDWSIHKRYLAKSFAERSNAVMEDSHLLADLILKITDQQPQSLYQSYRWLCDEFFNEERNFRKTNHYRYSKLNEVVEKVYHDREYMRKYMEGLLLSQLFWNNHAESFSFLKRHYFPNLKPQTKHLEIGPGHGLFTYLAATSGKCDEVYAWDISPTSLEMTAHCLKRLNVAQKVKLELRDVTVKSDTDQKFGSVVISEVLEHTEEPEKLLRSIRQFMAPDGKIFINVPVNSPAPDHIYLLRTPEEAAKLVESAGFEIVHKEYFPQTGLTLDQAREKKSTITCLYIAAP